MNLELHKAQSQTIYHLFGPGSDEEARAVVLTMSRGAGKCITEGIFNLSGYQLEEVFQNLELDYQEETIIRREISPGGKSRAFINDTPVNLDVLKKIGYRLMDIHSQHETLELGEQPFQLRLIDLYAGNEKIVKVDLS